MIPRTLFNGDHESFRDAFRRFLDKEVMPFHEQWEEQGYVDRKVWNKAGDNGYLCATLPEEYGGSSAVIDDVALSAGGASSPLLGINPDETPQWKLKIQIQSGRRMEGVEFVQEVIRDWKEFFDTHEISS